MVDSDFGSDAPSWLRRNVWTLTSLVLILALAGFFRVGFNYDPAINDGDYRFAGNDDYYHLRVAQSVQTEGQHLLQDPLLNYPITARNPRPPLFDWTAAIAGQVVHWTTGQSVLDGGAYALEWGSAFWGILTCIPVWLIGRTLYSNRAGLWAAFLLAATPAHIQRGGFGLGDHDAFIVFFLVLGFYFLVRALRETRDDYEGPRWRGLAELGDGFGGYLATHTTGLAYALLAGVTFAAIALTWEGFPYALAIYAIYYVFQLISNQLRRRDSTGDFLVMLTISATVTFLALPYYWTSGNVHATLTSLFYVILIMMIASLVFLPSRDLPSIVVMPAIALVGLVGLFAVLVVLPDIGRTLFSANGYFLRSKLYSTIAEAQRTELGQFVFSVGFMTFFLALVGTVYAVIRYFKERDRAQFFLMVWALFSIYMAFAAARFVFNAAPVFAVLAGWMVDKLVAWMNLRERVRDFQGRRQESFAKAVRSLVGAKQVAGSVFIVLTLVLPNVWLSFDAGFPSEVRANYRQNHPGAQEFLDNRTGAFGQGFLTSDWISIYRWMATQDTVGPDGRPLDCADRPGHMAWWDYGFWEVAMGCHPTVSDNFQNGFQLSGRFLAAEGEQEAVEWMTLRLLEGDRAHKRPRDFDPEVKAVLSGLRPGLETEINLGFDRGYDAARAPLHEALRDLDHAIDVYAQVRAATGWDIAYFLADQRMLPIDFPDTPSIESGSIFYAPVFLANKNPDDYVQTVYVDTRNVEYRLSAYDVDVNGDSIARATPRLEDSAGRVYIVSAGGIYRAMPDGTSIDWSFNQGQAIPIKSIKLEFKDKFYRTMFYKAYIGGDRPASGDYPQEFFQGIPSAGKGLRHFRLVKAEPAIRLLKYYDGAVAVGTVTFGPTGEPLPGIRVEAFDDLGIGHDANLTGPDGSYRVLLPFSTADANGTLQPVGVRLTADDGTPLGNATFIVTEAQARRQGDYNRTQDFLVEPASLSGVAFLDRDRDGIYNLTLDEPAAGVTVTLDEQPFRSTATDDKGRFALPEVVPGSVTLRLTGAPYAAHVSPRTLQPGRTLEIEVALAFASVQVNGTLSDPVTGEPLATVPVQFAARDPGRDYTANTTATSDSAGKFLASLAPGGAYGASVNATVPGNGTTYRYVAEFTFHVMPGDPPRTLTADELRLTRTEEPGA